MMSKLIWKSFKKLHMKKIRTGFITIDTILNKRFVFVIIMIMNLMPCKISGSKIGKGYRGFVEATFDATSFKVADDYHYDSSGLVLTGVHREGFVCAGISTSHGYQFNPHIYVGLGILGYYSQIDNGALIGTFLHIRTDQTFGKYTPYAEIRTGLKTDGIGPFFITPAIGYRFNFGHKTNLNVGIGLNLQFRQDPGSMINYGHYGNGPKVTVINSAIQPYFDFKTGIDF